MMLWCDGAHDAATDMARDAALLARAESGAEPVLRLFRFDPPGITLGASQRPERELDLAACARDGVGWAIRPTGGRAIFHAEEWTYALASPLDDPDWGGSQAEAYERVSRLLVASLERLGVPARLAPGTLRGGGAAGEGPRAPEGPAAPCFASTARHEVVLDGRKLVGSAQRRTTRALLQQGSLLLGDGHLRLADYLPVAEGTRARVRAALAATSAHAGAWLGGDAPLERWAEAFMELLPADTRRVDGGGLESLTLPESRPYTRRVPQVEP